MSGANFYDAMRHLADSWGLVAMGVLFAALAAWPFRPGARSVNEEAARIIFGDDENG